MAVYVGKDLQIGFNKERTRIHVVLERLSDSPNPSRRREADLWSLDPNDALILAHGLLERVRELQNQ